MLVLGLLNAPGGMNGVELLSKPPENIGPEKSEADAGLERLPPVDPSVPLLVLFQPAPSTDMPLSSIEAVLPTPEDSGSPPDPNGSSMNAPKFKKGSSPNVN